MSLKRSNNNFKLIISIFTIAARSTISSRSDLTVDKTASSESARIYFERTEAISELNLKWWKMATSNVC